MIHAIAEEWNPLFCCHDNKKSSANIRSPLAGGQQNNYLIFVHFELYSFSKNFYSHQH